MPADKPNQPQSDPESEVDPHHGTSTFSVIVTASRLGITLGIVGTVLAGFVLFAYGVLAMIRELWNIITSGWPDLDGSKELSVVSIQVTDLFLLGTVLNIVAIGLFQLFIDPTISPRLPSWLTVTSLDQLKSKLVGVIAVLLGVSFLAAVFEWDGSNDILYLGIAIAIVIVALGLLTSVLDKSRENEVADAAE